MPNRVLRPWTDSYAVNSLDDAGEVFFVRLIQCADDYGRFHGNPQLLKSYLYPLKDKRVADISRLIAECVKAGLIVHYKVNGREYIEIQNFKQRLRVKHESKFPPPEEENSRRDVMTDSCQSDVRQMTSGNGKREAEGGKQDEKKEDSSSLSPSLSEQPSASVVGTSGRSTAITFGYGTDFQLHGITDGDIADWKRFYPDLDIEQELLKASGWLKGHPEKQKSNILHFLTGWFQRSRDYALKIPTEKKPQEGQWRI